MDPVQQKRRLWSMEEVVARLLDDAVGVSKSTAAALGERGGNDGAMEMAACGLLSLVNAESTTMIRMVGR